MREILVTMTPDQIADYQHTRDQNQQVTNHQLCYVSEDPGSFVILPYPKSCLPQITIVTSTGKCPNSPATVSFLRII